MGGDALIMWETGGQIYWARAASPGLASAPLAVAGPGGTRKHPALAVDARGRIAGVWTEGTDWSRGGDLA